MPKKRIKSIFSNCSLCPLVNQTLVVGETNSEDDLSNVEFLVLAEAPSHEEIEQNRPLVGKAGRVFREVFEKTKLNMTPYYIGNIVSCSNIVNGKTQNPTQDIIELCSPNWKKLIEITKPKTILLMGSSAASIFNISGAISKLRGKYYDTEFGRCFLTFHPSYILRNGGLDTDIGKIFYEDLKSLAIDLSVLEEDLVETGPKLSEPYMHKLPDWCYSEDVALIDIQNIKPHKEILYSFKDANGKKIFHKESNKNSYYYYKNGVLGNEPELEKLENVMVGFGGKPNRANIAIYEGDVRDETKHAIDYRLRRGDTPEAKIRLKKMYSDIEVFSKGKRGFPRPEDAPSPINAISFKIDDGPVHVYVYRHKMMQDKKPNIKEGVIYKEFSSEGKLLDAWIDVIHKSEIDILCGWNYNHFDMPTILNRMRKIGKNINKLSPLGVVKYNPNVIHDFEIYGLYVLDLLDLYKKIIPAGEESYTLDAIARKNLGGDGKVAYEGQLDGVYMEDIDKFVEYSATDTELLYKLDMKLSHIALRFEMIRICSSTWKVAEKTTGLLDPLLISHAKKKGLVCRNSLMKEPDKDLPGAYVRVPVPGRHAWVVDFDYSSLYPSIICSFNLGPNTYIGRIADNKKIEKKINEEFNKNAYRFLYRRDKFPDKIKVTLDPGKESNKTVEMTKEELESWIKENDAIMSIYGTIFKGHNKELSFLTEVVLMLMESRKIYKKKMYEASESGDKLLEEQYHCMQWTYKILNNSIYGVLGNFTFRFFNHDIASSITLSGREAIQYVGHHIGQYLSEKKTGVDPNFAVDYEDRTVPYVAYTDTDSIFVQLGDYFVDEGI